MAEKTSKQGRKYDIDGKHFTWHPEDEDGAAGNVPDVSIPLRIKLKLVRKFAEREMDNGVMFEMLEEIIPNQADVLDEMDINDFQDMFSTWQTEYNSVTGASLGESESSSS